MISASDKTDIPTFYGEWIMNRIRDDYCKMSIHRGKGVARYITQCLFVVFWRERSGSPKRHHGLTTSSHRIHHSHQFLAYLESLRGKEVVQEWP